jgi:F420H(2)-dependent quinone reductase
MQIRLTSTGRRSGALREVTLYAYPDGDDLVVVGSAGGASRDPAWVSNLRAHPRATVRRGRRTDDVVAREVPGGSEYARLWTLVSEAFPLYDTYQRRTSRTIPLFVLEGAAAGTG